MSEPNAILPEALIRRFRDVRRSGRLTEADARGTGVSAACGDRVELTLSLDGLLVRDARFTAEGCAVAIAAAGFLAEAVVGRPDTAGPIRFEDIDAALGGIPRGREGCARAALQALDAALAERSNPSIS